MMKIQIAKSWLALLAPLALLACGGGGGAPSVSSLGATSVQYGRTMTVTVNGNSLLSTDLSMIIEGPCGPVVKSNGATDLQQAFTCTVTGIGDVIPRIRTPEGVELASLRLTVPLPQVAMTVTQGTRSGTYVLELDPVAARITVDNFLAYVRAGFYTSTLFHRVIAGALVQGGGFIAGPTPKAALFAPITLESNNGLKNLRGTVAMARKTDPNSATSEFYINLVDNPTLDYGSAESPAGYAVFGKVVAGFNSAGASMPGMDVVDEIGKVPVTTSTTTGLNNVPVSNVVITSVNQIK